MAPPKKKEWDGLHSKILIKIKFWSKETNERDLTPICLLGKQRLTVFLYDKQDKYSKHHIYFKEIKSEGLIGA